MNFRQQNSLTFGILSQIPLLLGKFTGFQRSLSNSLTFPGFLGQCPRVSGNPVNSTVLFFLQNPSVPRFNISTYFKPPIKFENIDKS